MIEWHPVSEKPEENVPLLIAKSVNFYTDYATSTYMNGGFVEYDSNYLAYRHKNVTHWAYIDPPED